MNKAKLFILTCLLGNSLSGVSQDWFIGPELGTNLMEIENNDLGTDFQLGFHGGGNVEYHFNSFFSLKSGIYVSQKRQGYSSYDSAAVNLLGFEDVLGIDGLNLNSYTQIDGTVSQIYLELPLMAAYTYERVSVFAGPYVGYMISNRTRERKEVTTPFLQTVDINALGIDDPTGGFLTAFLPPAKATTFTESSSKLGLRDLDVGVKGGVRYEMENLGLNLNYFYGFFDYQTTNKSVFENHSYLQFTLNYRFGIGR